MGFADMTSVGLCLGVVIIFIICILVDLVNAITKKAFWIPGEYLVLSTLTIQLLSLVTRESGLIVYDLKHTGNLNDMIKIDLWMIHSSRVMLCVVVAYLLPGMARRGSESSWVKMLALIIAIFINMSSELYRVRVASSWNCGAPGPSSSKYHDIWLEEKCTSKRLFVLSATINFISFTWLILLLGCAYIASRGIEVTIAQKRPMLLSSTPPSGSKWEWSIVEVQVQRCWVFARAYSPEFIIARSALTSSAATVVALQILTTFVAWLYSDHKVKWRRPIDLFKLVVTGLQCLFILMGCITIGFRWGATILYYKRWQSETWRSVFRVEDYWTRHIRDLLERKKQPEPEKRLKERIRKLSYEDPVSTQMPGCLLYLVLGLQWFTVLVSKSCWVTSLMVFHNKLMAKLWDFIFSCHDNKVLHEYKKYMEYFERLEMFQETPLSLWILIRRPMKLAGDLIKEGSEDAEHYCKSLINFIRGKSPEGSGIRCLDLYPDSKKHNNELLLQHLCKLKPPPLEVEKHFQEASKCSWKMTAVSLISIMVHLSVFYVQIEKDDQNCCTPDFPPEAVKISLDAYSQAWEIIDLVERMNQDDDNDGIVSQAADKLFCDLKNEVDKGTLTGKKVCKFSPPSLKRAIEDLATQSKRKTEPGNGHIGNVMFHNTLGEADNKKKSAGKREKAGECTCDDSEHSVTGLGNDSMDWKTAAAGIAVYKLCKSIDLASVKTPDDIATLLKEIQSSVADIIYSCLDQVLNNAVKWSVKCARESDEQQIARALYVVSKAWKVSEKLKVKQKGENAQTSAQAEEEISARQLSKKLKAKQEGENAQTSAQAQGEIVQSSAQADEEISEVRPWSR